MNKPKRVPALFPTANFRYGKVMTRLLQKAFEQASLLPESEQDAAGVALFDYLDQMHRVQLTDEQIAEVRRRLADPDRRPLTLEDVRSRFQNRS